jgi:hypothetical protein
MRRILALMAAFALLTPAVVAIAQTQGKMEPGPPKVLNIIREESKPGKTMAHRKHEAAWTQAFIQAGGFPYSLGMSSVTGPDEDWFTTGFESFAALEKYGESLESKPAYQKVMETYVPKESDFVSESRTITARYRPELSYKPDFKLGEYKYFNVAMVRYKLGSDPAEISKILNTARDKANMENHVVAYQVNSGMPVGTYIYFTPIKSLSEWDQPPNQAYTDALKEAKFDDEVAKSVQNVEFRLFAFNPKLSYMPESVTKLNPAFWTPKTQTAKAPAAKSNTPAAKKDAKPKQSQTEKK